MASLELPRKRGRPRHGVCPPSSTKVAEVLDATNDAVTPEELQARSGLPRRTLYFALHCMNALNLVGIGGNLRDMRRRRYKMDDQYRDGRWKPCLETGDC
jgi:hypothetical protein